jgi:hypothetical protein
VTVVCAKAQVASNKKAMNAMRARETEKFDAVLDFRAKENPATVRKRTGASLMRE